MRRLLSAALLAAAAALCAPENAQAGHSEYDAMVATQAQANGVPEALVHRVILRESRYQPHLVGRCGCIGLMQIKLATARSLGYTGDAAGLRDPNTNLTYRRLPRCTWRSCARHALLCERLLRRHQAPAAGEKRQRRPSAGSRKVRSWRTSPGMTTVSPLTRRAIGLH
jgi:hypothetical protein